MKRTLVVEWEGEDALPVAFLSGLRDQAKKWFQDHEYAANINLEGEAQ